MQNSPQTKYPSYQRKHRPQEITAPKGIIPPQLVGKNIKPGQVINPSGKPKGTRSIKTILEDLLAERYIDDPGTCNEAKKQLIDRFGLKAEQMTNKDVLFRQIFDDARKGDTFCRQFLAERTEGKIKDVFQFQGAGPLSVIVVKDSDEISKKVDELTKGKDDRANIPDNKDI